MEWSKLLSTRKLYIEEKEPKEFSDYPINEFEKDYNKIVSSAAFRRLQDKTQVFPLDKSDFIRTRLTHSIEVSTIARQLGIMFTKNRTKYCPKLELEESENIASVLLCAGLLHDLGNPPFGHFGEAVIGEWFENNLGKILYRCTENDKDENKQTLKDILSPQMCSDLEHFEGNAQAFRILAKAKKSSDINISEAVMSTLVKYPTDSLSFESKSENVNIHKPGYFLAEKEIFFEIAENVGTLCKNGQVCRHPLAYLLEAADDIAYATADLEDAFKKKLFTMQQFIDFYESKYDENKVNKLRRSKVYYPDHYSHELIENLRERLGKEKSESQVFGEWIKYVRRWLMHNVIFRYTYEIEKIMNGTYIKDVFYDINHSITIEILKGAMKEFVFDSPSILRPELSAQTILSFLLDKFVHAVLYYNCEDDNFKLTKADKKIINLLSENYRNDYEKSKTGDDTYDLYLRLLMVTDYISGMTDSFARRLYRELSGIE